MVNNRNDRIRETKHRIQAVNRAYYKYKSIMKTKEISRKTKQKNKNESLYGCYSARGNIWDGNNDPDKRRGRKTKKI